MDEISGALVGIALVLTAVFLPMSLFGGSTGVIYRQFSITIVSSMVLSVLVALIFTPALCATILKRPNAHGKRGFFGWFNRNFDRANRKYIGVVRRAISHPILSFLVFAGVLAVLAVVFLRIPDGFLPDEDQGVMFAQVVGPPGATSVRTQQVLDDVANYLRKDEASNVLGVFEVNGFSFGGHGQNSGLIFVKLTDWSQRPGERNTGAGDCRPCDGAFQDRSRTRRCSPSRRPRCWNSATPPASISSCWTKTMPATTS